MQRRSTVTAIAVAAASLGASGFAAAQDASPGPGSEPSPYFIGGSEKITYDSNVYRVRDGISDIYSSTSLLGGFDQPIGRSRLRATGTVSLNRYRGREGDINVDPATGVGTHVDTSDLNNTSYGLDGDWAWSTIENLSGNFGANLRRALANQTDTTVASTGERDLVTTQQYDARVRWGGASLATLEGVYSHAKVSYSAFTSRAGNSTSDSASIAGFYKLGGATRVGLAVRYSDTDQPQAIFDTFSATDVANKQKGRFIDLIGEWTPTAQTFINGRVSWARQTNSAVPSQDYKGWTGSLFSRYAITGKTSLHATLSRDAGVNGGFFTINANQPNNPTAGVPTPLPVTGLSTSTQISNSATLGADWAATAKINVTLQGEYRHARLVTGTTTTQTESTDIYRTVSLGARYEITRSVLMSCAVARIERDYGLSEQQSYTANTASCSAQFTLR